MKFNLYRFTLNKVEYLDEHDVNGYEVYVDNEPTLSCVTTTRGHHSSTSHSASSPGLSNTISDQSHSGSSNSDDITSSFASTGSHKHKKHNTCFTSSVLFLKSGNYYILDNRLKIKSLNTYYILNYYNNDKVIN